MMSEDKLINRIRALMRLAGNNPNENEAASAMAKATALMQEHNIQLADEVDAGVRQIKIVAGGYRDGMREEYKLLASIIAKLFHCKFSYQTKDESLWRMAGEETAVDVATETYVWVVSQIEVFYKDTLRQFQGSLTKKERADLRASFKGACAQRVTYRVRQIIGANSRALVLVTEDQIDEALGGKPIVKDVKKVKVGLGTAMGTLAGDTVQIRKEVQS